MQVRGELAKHSFKDEEEIRDFLINTEVLIDPLDATIIISGADFDAGVKQIAADEFTFNCDNVWVGGEQRPVDITVTRMGKGFNKLCLKNVHILLKG